jgi:hypothetical protein
MNEIEQTICGCKLERLHQERNLSIRRIFLLAGECLFIFINVRRDGSRNVCRKATRTLFYIIAPEFVSLQQIEIIQFIIVFLNRFSNLGAINPRNEVLHISTH